MNTWKRKVSLSITESVPGPALLDFVLSIISTSIALFCVILRVIARYHLKTGLAFNDYAIFWAMFWGLFLSINAIVCVTYGGVTHHIVEIQELAPHTITPMLKVETSSVLHIEYSELNC